MIPVAFNNHISSTTVFPAARNAAGQNFETESRDNIRFSGTSEPTLLDYAAINPDLTPEEIKLYEKAEREWHSLLDGINPARDFETLLARVKSQDDIAVKERLWVLTGKPGEKGWTIKNTPDEKTTILLWNEHGYVNEAERTEILAHELLHALHVRYGLLKSKQERIPDPAPENARTFESKLYRQDNLSEYICYFLTADKLGPSRKPTLKEVLLGLLKLRDVGKDYRRKKLNYKLAEGYKPYL